MRVVLCFSAVLVIGCSSLIGLDEFKPNTDFSAGGVAGSAGAGAGGAPGSAGVGGAGGLGGSPDAGAGGTEMVDGCPATLKGPSMSRMRVTDDQYFCIDTTEVTNAQYEEFVTFGSLSGQPSACSFNTTYAPQMGSSCGTFGYDPGSKPNHPVTCIDWCDAFMYCQWAAKRLCGAIDGGAVAASDRTNPAVAQWHNACTLNGSRSFSYGNAYASGRCNDLTSPSAGPFLCGGFNTCSGNYPGEAPVYDMSGNVQEWEDSSCSARGGDWLAYEGTAACAQTVTANRDVRDHHRGFRCCWDPPSN